MQVPGYNFLGGDPADTRDVLGHGTAVAGPLRRWATPASESPV